MMFAAELHVMPWNLGRLTTSQVDEAVAHFDDLRRKAEQLSSK